MTQKTWNEFWGDLLLRRCHEHSPHRWTKREERAKWLYETLSLWPGCRVLDLGCGDGILDICLARLGAKATGIDRIRTVLEAARTEAGSEEVDFIVDDLRDIHFPPASFDVVLMIELVGLMGKSDDVQLVRNANEWLAGGGQIVMDCPLPPGDAEGQSQQELPDGTLRYHWTYDRTTRLQHIVPVFHMRTGEIIELHDPYDSSKPNHLGVLRYVYPKTELWRILEENRFVVRDVERHWREDSYLLIGECVASMKTSEQDGS